jgi:hypothetical protein
MKNEDFLFIEYTRGNLSRREELGIDIYCSIMGETTGMRLLGAPALN